MSAPHRRYRPPRHYADENWVFNVVDGPICADNYIWWAISGSGIHGWVAERNNAVDFILDFRRTELTCTEPLDLAVGEEITLARNVRIRTPHP